MYIRYVNDLGNGHSGYATIASGIPIQTTGTDSIAVTASDVNGLALLLQLIGKKFDKIKTLVI